jgi:hypothetical protein
LLRNSANCLSKLTPEKAPCRIISHRSQRIAGHDCLLKTQLYAKNNLWVYGVNLAKCHPV